MATRRRSRNKTIAGNLTDVQKRLRYLEVRPNPDKLASKSVATKNIALRAIQTDLISDAAITRRTLAQAVVGTAQIEDRSITTTLIAENGVTGFNIAPDAVSTSELATGAVTNDELGSYAVTNLKIDTDSIDNRVVAPDAIGTNEIINESVTSSEVGLDAIGNSELANNAVDTANIVDGSVTDGKVFSLAGGKITGVLPLSTIPSLPADRVTSGIFADARIPALTAAKIPTLDASKIVSGTFSLSLIPDLGTTKITAGVFDTARIPLITNAMLAGGISNGKIASVDAGTIITGTIGINRLPGEVLTDVNAGSGITVSGSGRTRTVSFAGSGYALASHTHSQYAPTGRYDTSFAGSHVGHGGHTHFTTISSRKLKKEISDYNINLDKLFLLQPKKFKYRNQARNASKNREWDYGYIAEEARDLGVEEILGYDENGEVDSINYSILSVFVLELVKKQQNEINFLSEEIKRLKETK